MLDRATGTLLAISRAVLLRFQRYLYWSRITSPQDEQYQNYFGHTHTNPSIHVFLSINILRDRNNYASFMYYLSELPVFTVNSPEGQKECRILVIALWTKINHHYLYYELIFTIRNIYKGWNNTNLLPEPWSALSSVVYAIKKNKNHNHILFWQVVC